MNPLNLFKFLEKEKGRQIPVIYKILHGLPLTPKELNNKKQRIDLSYTNVTSIPSGLKAGKLDIEGTRITSLPQDIEIGYLFIGGTPLASKPSTVLDKMLPNVYFYSTDIEHGDDDLDDFDYY